MKIIRAFLFLSIFVFACSPKYKVEKIYHPPKDKACLDKCQQDFIKCENICTTNYKKCLKESIDRANKIYSKLRKEYEENLKNYYEAYRNYQKQFEIYQNLISSKQEQLKFYEKICSKYKDKDACYRRDMLRREIENLKRKKPIMPKKPIEVSYEDILKKERNICTCDCGCKELYDACYQSCGGYVEIKKICVENCD